MQEVANPSELFLAGRPAKSTGSVVVSSLEGSRPILVELQALVTATGYAMPQAHGEWDRIESCGAVAGRGWKNDWDCTCPDTTCISTWSADFGSTSLRLTSALLRRSFPSFRDQAFDSQTCCIGEVGLGGEIRPVSRVDLRIREAMKLGFQRCVLPQGNLDQAFE